MGFVGSHLKAVLQEESSWTPAEEIFEATLVLDIPVSGYLTLLGFYKLHKYASNKLPFFFFCLD